MKEIAAGTLFEDWDMLAPKTIKVRRRNCAHLTAARALHCCARACHPKRTNLP